MTENKNVETILKNGDKALSGMPYLYRSKGLPSEVYDVRMREGINGELLKLAIADTVIRYPSFICRKTETPWIHGKSCAGHLSYKLHRSV